ncbi:MAG: hypothetical protein K6G61_11470 [Solobacterium sp.]|nr:hypothetical protein [Solobacterium sp.]
MSKASRRQKLTDEELKQENKKLKQRLAQGSYSKEDQERIVNILSTQNIIAYTMVLFIPPVGVWYIWTRREKLHLNRTSVYLWTFVGAVILIQYIMYIMNGFSR